MDTKTAVEVLARPFAAAEVKWKAQTVKDNRCLAVAYIDARAVMDRLDEAVGAENWRDDYELLEGGAVLCRLALRLGGEWIVKADVGGESEQPDDGDKRKASVSDALKRAAVKWGIGRYLYRLPKQWVDYDPKRRAPVKVPTLPAWALPRRGQAWPPEPGGEMPRGDVTEAQMKKLAILCEQHGYTRDDLKREFGGKVSRTQLTRAEASSLIDRLERGDAEAGEEREAVAAEGRAAKAGV